jgi:serine/threonine protein kinase/ABC-type phosphate/phosphonate transport system substrate-binding protein
MNDFIQSCAECRSELPADVPPGLCPRCALQNVLNFSSAETSALPRAFGDYELLEEIARGGMGIVYKARQKNLGRIVVVKMLLGGSHSGHDLIHRFKKEGVAAARLQHPNIVPIHEVGLHDGQHFIVMDFVAGPSLAHYARTPLPSRRAAELLATITSAIHYAHQRQVLHRDLKPSNVILDESGQPHVMDFGLAKGLGTPLVQDGLANDDATVVLHQQRTVEGQVLGSPGYMPPEQADGRTGAVGPWSDVYSLGAMLYHLLTGVPPFKGASVADTLHRVLHDEVVPPHRLTATVPLDLETICLKCLEKDSSRRYQTAEEMADELGRFLRGEPIQARPISSVHRMHRWARRNPAGAGLIGALALGLAVLSGLVKVLHDRGEEQEQAIADIRRLVVENIEELWPRPDKIFEQISSEQLAALAGKRKSPAPLGALRLKVGLGATVAPVERATTHQPTLDFLERQMERALHLPVRLDLVLFKEGRLDQHIAHENLHLARVSALGFLRARETNPKLVPIVQENAPKDAVIFARTSSGISNLIQLRGRSVAFADTNSTIDAWAKVFLVRAGIRAADLSYHSNLTSQVLTNDRESDFHAHKEAFRAVREERFDAAVGRSNHVKDELGAEGTNWVALLKFESSRTLWVAGSRVTAEVREALSSALLGLSRLPWKKQQDLRLPVRLRNFIPINSNALKELEEALDRDLRLFESPAAPGPEPEDHPR